MTLARFVLVLAFAGCGHTAAPTPRSLQSATADLHVPIGATATTLRDSRVLITGGYHGEYEQVSSCVIWDPRTHTMTATGSMTTTRTFHAATLLADDRVLVTGAVSSSWDDPVPTSAEVWDPRTGRWSATGTMTDRRSWHTATRLRDGRVLLVGGVPKDDAGADFMSSSAELWNPSTGQFTKTAALATSRAHHLAALLQDGRVLIVGGETLSGDDQFTDVVSALEAFVWDPRTGMWASAGTQVLNYRDDTSRVDVFANGRVRISRPRLPSDDEIPAPDPAAEEWSPVTNQWSVVQAPNISSTPSAVLELTPDCKLVKNNDRFDIGSQVPDPLAANVDTWP